ncbi:MAG: V-type ATP synthase subunit K [Desulfurococcales archaeon]|nr:V-type ATP synthase subunit K [Desulfurococcales archaeon]
MMLRVLWADKRFRILSIIAAVLAVTFALATASVLASAQEQGGMGGGASNIYAKAIGSAIAVGLAGIGGGYAVGVAGAAAVSAVAENREISGTALLYVALGEGIAIYGLIVALVIIFVL